MHGYMLNIQIRIDPNAPENAVASVDDLVLAIHAAASQIDLAGSMEDEIGVGRILLRGRRVGQITVDKL